nr:hypothetical protein CFP56_08115 [Quercus suber]
MEPREAPRSIRDWESVHLAGLDEGAEKQAFDGPRIKLYHHDWIGSWLSCLRVSLVYFCNDRCRFGVMGTVQGRSKIGDGMRPNNCVLAQIVDEGLPGGWGMLYLPTRSLDLEERGRPMEMMVVMKIMTRARLGISISLPLSSAASSFSTHPPYTTRHPRPIPSRT